MSIFNYGQQEINPTEFKECELLTIRTYFNPFTGKYFEVEESNGILVNGNFN